jgi:hypothetical protein
MTPGLDLTRIAQRSSSTPIRARPGALLLCMIQQAIRSAVLYLSTSSRKETLPTPRCPRSVLPMNILHYLDQPVLPPVGSQAWINQKATTPTLITLKDSRPTSEPPISPVYDEDWGPSKEYCCIVYLALIIGLIALNSVESKEPIAGTEDLWGEREISCGVF